MKKSVELKKTVDALMAKAAEQQAAQQFDDAMATAMELKEATQAYNLQVAIEAAEMTNFANNSISVGGKKCSDSVMANRVFNKRLLGRQLNADEQEWLNDVGDEAETPLVGQREGELTKGGYLVPEEQINQLREYRKAYTALKDYCSVHTANSISGSMPTLGDESGLLTKFDEMGEINRSDFEFGQLKYSIADYGDIIPVSNQLLQDANVNIMEIIGRRFARKSINTENAAILALLKPLETGSITNYKSIMKALNVDLDPVYFANARIFTNQDGFQWLAELSDSQSRPLLVPDVAASETYRFRGKEVVVLSNNVLKTDTDGKKIPVYVGNMADYVAFFQRLGLELAVSDQAGFTQYTTLIRAVQRFGVIRDDENALKGYTISYT